jgi:hypothetical protein
MMVIFIYSYGHAGRNNKHGEYGWLPRRNIK